MLEPRVAVSSGRLFGKLVESGVFFVECLGRARLVIRTGRVQGFCSQNQMPGRYRGSHNSKETSKKLILGNHRGNHGIRKLFTFHEGQNSCGANDVLHLGEIRFSHKALRKTNI